MSKILKLTFLPLFLLTIFAANAQNPVSWSHKVVREDSTTFKIIFHAEIKQGYKLYDLGPYPDGPNPTVFTFAPEAGMKLDGKVYLPVKSQRSHDEMFDMEIGYFKKSGEFVQKVKVTEPSATIVATVEWMSCDDTSCTPPDDEEFTIKIDNEFAAAVKARAAAQAKAAAAQKKNDEKVDGEPADVTAVASVDGEEVVVDSAMVTEGIAETTPSDNGAVTSANPNDASGKSLWAIILEAIAWGFAALLTPCVFPMVPMTVSFFMKSGDTQAKGRFNASLYGFFIVALYTLPIAAIILITRVVGGDAVTADIFNWLATHWLPNTIFFLVFMIFAASFFGAFEITMPSWMVNKSDKGADKGGIMGIFFLALTLVLVSFSCTGPIVGMVLIKSTAGEFWQPIIAMLAFSIAFALPFTFFAFFPTLLNKLPKSGGWLNSVKVVLGFIEVALGLKFLSVADQTYHWGILDREIYLAIWIVVFSLMGAYLLGKLKFAHDSETKHIGVPKLFLAIITFSFVVYMIPGMFGAPLKGLSGYLPPMHTQDFIVGGGGVSAEVKDEVSPNKAKYSDFLHLPHGLDGFFDYNEALEYSKKIGKPLLVDYTGHGCVNCREMEARVWSAPEVLEIMRSKYVILALYSDDKKNVPESDWVTDPESGRVYKSIGKINSHLARTKFNANSQPYYMLLDNNGELLIPARAYDLNIDGFVKFLNDGVEEYNKRMNK